MDKALKRFETKFHSNFTGLKTEVTENVLRSRKDIEIKSEQLDDKFKQLESIWGCKLDELMSWKR